MVLKLFTLSFLCAYEELLLIEKKKRNFCELLLGDRLVSCRKSWLNQNSFLPFFSNALLNFPVVTTKCFKAVQETLRNCTKVIAILGSM